MPRYGPFRALEPGKVSELGEVGERVIGVRLVILDMRVGIFRKVK